MTSTQQLSTLAAANCEVAFDNLTRQLYATDASIYQIEPVAVAFPKATKQAVAIVEAASQAGIADHPARAPARAWPVAPLATAWSSISRATTDTLRISTWSDAPCAWARGWCWTS